jgi:hypothetical protein
MTSIVDISYRLCSENQILDLEHQTIEKAQKIVNINFNVSLACYENYRVRCYALRRKFVSSIRDEVLGFFNYLVLPTAHSPDDVDLPCNINEYQKSFRGINRGQRVTLTTSTTSVS